MELNEFVFKHKIMIFSNSINGYKSFRFEILEKLLEMENEVFFIAPDNRNNYLVSEFENLGVHYKQIMFNRRGKNPLHDLNIFFNFFKMIKKNKPSLVLTEGIKPNVYAGLACRLLNVPYISNVTGLGAAFEKENILKKIAIFLYKISMKDCYRLYCQNEFSKKVLQKNLKNVPITVLPGSGVNLNKFLFKEYPVDQGYININYVGRILRIKGIEEFLYCAEYIKKKYPQVIFRIIGNFDDIQYVEIVKKYKELGIIQHVEYQRNIMPFIEKSHLVINASYSEGMSNVLLEHAAVGRPSIASNITGCKEIIKDGETGFLFEKGNKKHLIEQVEKFLLLNYQDKASMGKKARKHVEEFFDRNVVINEYETMIRRILSKSEVEKNGICKKSN